MIRTIVLVAGILVLSNFCEGHSHLAHPLPTRRLDCRAGGGRPRNCFGPCPALDTYGGPTGISPRRPAATWRRGEQRTVTWHRNNHGKGESGFVRLTLVPVNKMMDRRAHEKFTFQISCWSSGLHKCKSRNKHVCGNDKEGMAYKAPITVPTAYPDGVYVLGWAWYGGGDFKGDSFFGDYYSCSFVKITGGAPVSSASRPVFSPGYKTRYSDGCLSSTDRVGVCRTEPCRGHRMQKRRPRDLPRSISSRDLGSEGTSQTRPTGVGKGARGGRSAFRVGGLIVYSVKTMRGRDTGKKSIRVNTKRYSRGFTLGLSVSGPVEKVTFRGRGIRRTERKAPFIVNGNSNGRLSSLKCRRNQVMRFTATVYGLGRQEEHKFSVKCI